MNIDLDKRPEFESRVKEFLNLYAYNISPTIYEDEAVIEKLASAIAWEKQSPLEDKKETV